ncbi:hypothetical protein F5B19DRAFT_246380 [Rostrohypoxylon terebratum]|nr:hypothetical protein F5B19DRAFT_246380 [Rostrohypoxylon terebratum]
MSEQQQREETPEPEEQPNQLVEQNTSHKHAWDVEDRIRALVRATVQFGDLISNEGREHFPEFPHLHDQTWLTFQTKVKNAVSTAERFVRKADSNGWFREQAMLQRQGFKQRPSKQSFDMVRLSNHVTNLLEDAAALQGQILAGQHRKPSGEKRLDRPKFAPFTHRQTNSATNSEAFRGSLNDLKDRVDQLGVNAAIMERGIKDRHLALELAPLKDLKQMKWRQEQSTVRPSLVLAKHEPLEYIKETKGGTQAWTPYVEPLSAFEKKIEDCKRAGHPPNFGTFLQDAYYGTPQLPKSVEDNDDQKLLPSIYRTFYGTHFMETDFAEQVQAMKASSTLPQEKKESDVVAEAARKAIKPLVTRTLNHPGLRIATRHQHLSGALEVAEYRHNHNTYYLAHEHWAGVAKPAPPQNGNRGGGVLTLAALGNGDFEIPKMSPRRRTREWVHGQSRVVQKERVCM